MIEWTPVAVNEKPLLRGRRMLPEYSAAVIGSAVVLRHFGGGFLALHVALTTIPFPTAEDAKKWVQENRTEMQYDLAGSA